MNFIGSFLFARKQSEHMQACLHICERAREPEKRASQVGKNRAAQGGDHSPWR